MEKTMKFGSERNTRIFNQFPVVFPEGQTFMPLEMVEAYQIDTTRLKDNQTWQLTREYALTQWDSGSYVIPKQKIIVNDQSLFTDSIKVEVATVVVPPLAHTEPSAASTLSSFLRHYTSFRALVEAKHILVDHQEYQHGEMQY